MKKTGKNIFLYIIIILLMLLIGASLVVSSVFVERYAEDECLDNIAKTTDQITNMFNHTFKQKLVKLESFAGNISKRITVASRDELSNAVREYCTNQGLAAMCLHTKDGGVVTANNCIHNESNQTLNFDTEAKKTPYNSNIISFGELRSQKYFYQAVSVKAEGQTEAILYSYMNLDMLSKFIPQTAGDELYKIYIVDGNSGEFMVDEYHRYTASGTEIKLGKITDTLAGNREVKPGYSVEEMQDNIVNGKNGYFVFRSVESGEWCYAYHTPTGINKWTIQLTIDESNLFANFYNIRRETWMLLSLSVLLMFLLLVVIMLQDLMRRRINGKMLYKAEYQSSVQSALISAHNNTHFVDRALRIINDEVGSETVLLLLFDGRVINQVYYWPSIDKNQAMALMGINVREVFPAFFDSLDSNKTVVFDSDDNRFLVSKSALEVFKELEVSNIMLSPITDTSGVLKGAIAAVNLPKNKRNPEMLECVSRDFFMAIANLENQKIIKRMGEMDYLTGLKNRNSFESELLRYEEMNIESLWFVYIDANGLHEINNTKGHKAGDLMLCNIADTMKKIFGSTHTYRLGGDEFAAFVPGSTHEDLMSRKYRLLDELAKRGHSVSAGFAGARKNENNVFDVEKLVSDAEKIMYQNKREYYAQNHLTSERYRIEQIDDSQQTFPI